VVPFYDQTFHYAPGPLAVPAVGATLDETGVFTLRARGGLALDVALARDLGRHALVAARLDTADVSVNTTGAQYTLRVALPAPLPPLSTTVDLGTGTVDLERLKAWSLDVGVHTGGRVRVALSAGPSWLPAFRFAASEGVGVGLPTAGAGRATLDVGHVVLSAEAQPQQSGQGRFGGNAGLSIDYALGGRAAFRADARYFRFQEQTLVWGHAAVTSGPLSAVEEALVGQIETRLPPVVFNPSFIHASAGLVVRF